jgi:hypothetical protein
MQYVQGHTNCSELYASVIGVPALGVDPIETWTVKPQYDGSSFKSDFDTPDSIHAAFLSASPIYPIPTIGPPASTWITCDIRKAIPEARVLLYDHGELDGNDTLKILSLRLLKCLREQRKRDV